MLLKKNPFTKDIQEENRATQSYETSKQNMRSSKKIKDEEMAVRQ